MIQLKELLSDGIQIVSAKGIDKNILESMFTDAFPKHANLFEYVLDEANLDKSIVLLDNGDYVGFYFVGDRQVRDVLHGMRPLVDTRKYDTLKGIEGVALGVRKNTKVKDTETNSKMKYENRPVLITYGGYSSRIWEI